MKAKWNEMPISELQYDYGSVKRGDGYGCVVGRVKANDKATGRINHDFVCYAISDFCYARMAWAPHHLATQYHTMQRTGQ
eukprot:8150128-Karenia_brevis.AAC.1